MSKKLNLIMANDEGGNKGLWACRGAGKGCERNKYRNAKKPCEDCMGPLDGNLTLEQAIEKLEQGDA